MPEYTHKPTGRVVRTVEGTRVHDLVSNSKDYEPVKVSRGGRRAGAGKSTDDE